MLKSLRPPALMLVLAAVVCVFGSPARVESQVSPGGAPIAINEVLVDDNGNLFGEFIELFNVSSQSIPLTGWTLQFWFGGNQTQTLHLTGTIPGRGYYLIAPAQYAPMLPHVDFTYSQQVPLRALNQENGSLVLTLNGVNVSDTVAWGNFPINPTEGIPFQSPPPGLSMARLQPGQDTDHNEIDFQLGPPTPKSSVNPPEPGNLPPVFQPIPPQKVSEGATLTLQVSASDPEGGFVLLSAGPLPPGANFIPAAGLFTWDVPFGAAANFPYNATFLATDDQNQTVSLSVQIFVLPAIVTVNIESPTTNPTFDTTAPSVLLTGTLSPAPAVQIVSWTNAATGQSGTATGVSPWSVLIALNPGPNSIQISAMGTTGVVGTDSIVVTYIPPQGSLLLTVPAQIPEKKPQLVASVEVATSGDVGTTYLGGQVLVLAPDGSVRDSVAIVPVVVTNGAHVTLTYAVKNAFGSAKNGDSLSVTVTLTGVKNGKATFGEAEAAIVKVVAP